MAVVVLMSAIVPTRGHAALIQFAQRFAASTSNGVEIYIGTRQGEPTTYAQRRNALAESILQIPSYVPTHFHEVDETGVTDQYELYNGIIKSWDYVVSSEEYARNLNGTSIPYDIDRLNDPSHGTDVRADLWRNFSSVLPTFRQHIGYRVTLFGQESVGKTTLTKGLAPLTGFSGRAEFARPYLEHRPYSGYDLWDMKLIWKGQKALQEMPFEAPILIQDTDLFSTLGYYRIMDEEVPKGFVADAKATQSDLYIILDPETVPFEKDPLRYGGDHRESELQFWVDLAEEFDLNYIVRRADEVKPMDLAMRLNVKNAHIRNYRRPI